jgi:hypothetical protein
MAHPIPASSQRSRVSSASPANSHVTASDDCNASCLHDPTGTIVTGEKGSPCRRRRQAKRNGPPGDVLHVGMTLPVCSVADSHEATRPWHGDRERECGDLCSSQRLQRNRHIRLSCAIPPRVRGCNDERDRAVDSRSCASMRMRRLSRASVHFCCGAVFWGNASKLARAM